ncbi:RloB-like protein [Streptomyces harbinensis]|uniref:RloB-like protein n=1 Tax=Streptomyces harbinensis TaxID=1176198 RepID=A0A1I6W9A1_9ACTN|nr:RloB-like protein [Streptomyces harbinensis]
MARRPGGSPRRGPRFESDLRRTSRGRQPRERILVFCDSDATERDYLRALVNHVANPAVTVKIRNKPCSPSQLVAYAADFRDSASEDFDRVWCVFDVDDYPDIHRAVRSAHRLGIELAVSNPCFELWLLLHHTPHTAHSTGYRQLAGLLGKHVPGYDKARINFLRDFAPTWEEAVDRARALAPAGREYEVNPATGVWSLVRLIGGQAR